MKWIPFNFFILAVMAHFFTACVYRELPNGLDCTGSDLSISLITKSDATSCQSIDGNATMEASGGIAPYDYSLGDGIYQTNPVFDRLAPGSYLITVKDFKGCKRSIQVDLGAAGSTLSVSVSTTEDNDCFSDNGSVMITASNGASPYVSKIDNGTFGPLVEATGTFRNLSQGNHSVMVKDANDCERILIVTIPRGGTGVSFANDIEPIFIANCNFTGCHGAGTTGRDWTKYADVKIKSKDIKTRTGNRSMPIGDYSLTTVQIQQIACWVDDGANNN